MYKLKASGYCTCLFFVFHFSPQIFSKADSVSVHIQSCWSSSEDYSKCIVECANRGKRTSIKQQPWSHLLTEILRYSGFLVIFTTQFQIEALVHFIWNTFLIKAEFFSGCMTLYLLHLIKSFPLPIKKKWKRECILPAKLWQALNTHFLEFMTKHFSLCSVELPILIKIFLDQNEHKNKLGAISKWEIAKSCAITNGAL